MRFGSVFAGIGGFDLGFERAGLSCAWQIEIDPYCQRVLARHWPDVPRFADVRQVTVRDVEHLPAIDLLVGGFPCQDLSVAGKRAGLKGQRSGLYYELTRLLNEIRPPLFIWENVPGLLSSHQGHDFGAVLAEMDRLGYVGGWRVLDAQHFGLAQRRKRIFACFARADIGAERAAKILALTEGAQGHLAPSSDAREGAPASPESGALGCGERARYVPVNDVAPTVTTNARGVAGRFLEAGGLVAEAMAFNWQSGGSKARLSVGELPSLICGQTPAVLELPPVAWALQERDAKGSDSSTKPGHLIPFAWDGAQITSKTNRSRVEPGMPSPTMTRDARLYGGVRRLTPTECERLQGFSDGWTAFTEDGQPINDTQRYRMIGNAVAVPCAEWIGRRIANTEEEN